MQMVMIDKAVLERAIDTLRLKYSDQIYDGVGSTQASEFEDDVEALRELLVQTQPVAAQPLSDDKLEQFEAAVKELAETLEDLADYAGAFSVDGVYLIEDKHARALLAQAYKLVLKHDN